MTPLNDLTGKVFGAWKVLGSPSYKRNSLGQKIWYWECICDCGKIKSVRGEYLKTGRSKSCGCLKNIKHGHCKKQEDRKVTKVYGVWTEMLQRCCNPNVSTFSRYGGRGITVCDRWLGEDGFQNFLADMGEPPKGMTLDRIDNDLGYSPENCRWVDIATQARNRVTNRWLEIEGKKLCCKDAAQELQIPYSTLRNWLKQSDSVQKIVEKAKARNNFQKHLNSNKAET